jgi:thioredoxin reductase
VVYDVAIVGAGPVGLFAAYYAGLRDMRTVVVESLPIPGGQLSTLYPEKSIFDVAGFPGVRAHALVRRLMLQAKPFQPELRLGERALGLTRLEDGSFLLETDRGQVHTRSVIVAAGIGAFEPVPLAAPGVQEYLDRGVSYTVHDLSRYQGRRCLVIGGGNTAMDYALMLAPVCRELTLIHRRDVFRAHEASVRRLWESGARILPFYELREVRGDGRNVTEAVVYDNRTGEEQILPVDRVVVGLGFKSRLGPLAQWGFEVRGNKIVTTPRMHTTVPGVFACGDVVTYDGKLDLIATGFGEAAVAANEAKHYVSPQAKVFPGHSSDRPREHRASVAELA